jgi:hypothetical protein
MIPASASQKKKDKKVPTEKYEKEESQQICLPFEAQEQGLLASLWKLDEQFSASETNLFAKKI